jgi:hypothetical protein
MAAMAIAVLLVLVLLLLLLLLTKQNHPRRERDPHSLPQPTAQVQ